jgi:hypothetical protein
MISGGMAVQFELEVEAAIVMDVGAARMAATLWPPK